MIPYLAAIYFTFQSLLVSAIPIFSNNQVPGLQVLPIQPGLDLSSNYYQLYTPENNNQVCPCHNPGNSYNGINPFDLNNIFNNPLVNNILTPSCSQRKDEVQASKQLQNCPAPSKIPSVVNNYIVIPPEAFSGNENNVENNKTKQKPSSERKNKSKNASNNQGRRKTSNKRKDKKKSCGAQNSSTSIKSNDPEVEVFDSSNNLKVKESLTVKTPKANQRLKSKCKSQTGTTVNNAQPMLSEAMDIMRESDCCTENRTARHLVNDFNLMNFHQMFPFFPGFPLKKENDASLNKCCGNQMMFPDFSSLYNNPYSFNYQQLLKNAKIDIKNQKARKANGSNTKIKVKTNPTSKTVPTVHLYVKVDADNKVETKSDPIEKHIVTHESLTKEVMPDVIEVKTTENKTVERSAKIIQLNVEEENRVTELSPTAITTESLPIFVNNTKESLVAEDLDFQVNDDNKNLSEADLKEQIESLPTPELGFEEKVPTLHENYIIEDYYPDFRNDDKNLGTSETEDMSIDTNYDHVDLSRDRRKFDSPFHGQNSLHQQQSSSRNYYKLDRDPALNEIPTTEDPQLKKSSKTEVFTTVQTNESSEEIMYFITPPSLDKIDFKTKQINKDDIRNLDEIEEYDHVKDKKIHVDSKSSTFSDAKVTHSINLKPKNDVKFKETSPIFHDIETVYGNSKVVRYGKAETEDTLEKPFEEEYSEEKLSDEPFIVMAQPVLQSGV